MSKSIVCGGDIPDEYRCRGCQSIVPAKDTRWVLQWSMCPTCTAAWREHTKGMLKVEIGVLFDFLRSRMPKGE